jgi:hypothetical protein
MVKIGLRSRMDEGLMDGVAIQTAADKQQRAGVNQHRGKSMAPVPAQIGRSRPKI